MTKRFLPGKGLAIWSAISVVIIVIGLVIGGVFGFNYTDSGYKTVEVSYDSSVMIEKKEEALAEACEKVFQDNSISFEEKTTVTEMDTGYIAENGNYMLRYKFCADVSDETLRTVADAIRTSGAQVSSGADITVSYHTYSGVPLVSEATGRAVAALVTAAVVALVYVGFRFGWDSALAGFAACANDTFATLAILVLTRIPVQATAPLLYAGIAFVLSAVLWLIQCMKMRENFKDPSYAGLSAEEAVASSVRSGVTTMLAVVIPLVWVFVLFGVIATGGTRLFMLLALLPLAVSVYSSLLLAPSVYVPLKKRFDRIRSKRKRYAGKKKEEPQQQE